MLDQKGAAVALLLGYFKNIKFEVILVFCMVRILIVFFSFLNLQKNFYKFLVHYIYFLSLLKIYKKQQHFFCPGRRGVSPNILMDFWPATGGKFFGYIGKYTESNGSPQGLTIPPGKKNTLENSTPYMRGVWYLRFLTTVIENCFRDSTSGRFDLFSCTSGLIEFNAPSFILKFACFDHRDKNFVSKNTVNSLPKKNLRNVAYFLFFFKAGKKLRTSRKKQRKRRVSE